MTLMILVIDVVGLWPVIREREGGGVNGAENFSPTIFQVSFTPVTIEVKKIRN